MKPRYSKLAMAALTVLIPFPKSYLCELGHELMAYWIDKYRISLEDVNSHLLLNLNLPMTSDI